MGKDDQRIPLGIARSGQYLGEMSLLTGSNHTASAVALTDVTTIRLDKTAINHQLETAPPWLVALTRGLVDRLIIANNMLIRHNIIDDSLVSAISAIEVKQKASEEKNPPKIPKTSQNETISKKTETATSDKPKPKKEGNKAS